jgi:hypothetical protein
LWILDLERVSHLYYQEKSGVEIHLFPFLFSELASITRGAQAYLRLTKGPRDRAVSVIVPPDNHNFTSFIELTQQTTPYIEKRPIYGGLVIALINKAFVNYPKKGLL